MSWNFYRPYVSVAQRRANAVKHAQKLAKKGQTLAPVKIEGRTIARTFWGQAWCRHLESYGDYANRLPRGRTYVRNGSVIDLQIAPGKITATVMGSEIYRGTITILPLKSNRWKTIKADCAGKIDSLVGLLQGRLSDAVMKVITDRERGLFPAPAEIRLECSCPDWADLCKHHAAVLYGVGARLDARPELLFVLRGVDHLELIAAAADAPALAAARAGTDAGVNGLDTAQLAEVFGIEIDPSGAGTTAQPVVSAATNPKRIGTTRKVRGRPEAKTAARTKPKTKTGRRGKAR